MRMCVSGTRRGKCLRISVRTPARSSPWHGATRRIPVRVFLRTHAPHARPLKRASAHGDTSAEDGQLLVTGGQDEVVNVWKVRLSTATAVALHAG